MGKLLSLGPKLQYPITITRFHKQKGEKISREEKILEFKWTTQVEVGDFVNQNTWKEDQVSFGDWDSSIDGQIISWKVKEGQVIERDMKFIEVEEDCPHSIQFQGLCGICGKDMTEIGFASATADTTRAQINMIHDQMSLKVSKDEATRVEDETQRRLLKSRKLSLVVDLDCTVIHAAVDPTIWEWMNDKESPNYAVCQDIARFQLEEGPRNLPQGYWYYVKQRPGLTAFLDKMAELYELHIYTMGTRAYARNIAKVVDPTKRLFGDRIISRDENGSMTEKNLARLFPDNTKMVAIIDDRSDVWPMNRSNLIKVVPFNFFPAVGDINASFLPKLQEAPRLPTKKKTPEPEAVTANDGDKMELTEEKTEATEAASGSTEAQEEVTEKPAEATEFPEVVEEEAKAISPPAPAPVRVSEEAVREEQIAEQGRALEEQLIERPLLHLQEKLDQEDEKIQIDEVAQNGSRKPSQRRHPLLSEDDNELHYVQNHLALLHKTFYDQYDAAIRDASGGRVAQLKPGAGKKLPIKEAKADLKLVPDIADILPRLKAPLLKDCTIVLSGLVPLVVDVLKSELGLQVKSFGADLRKRITKRVTHLVTESSRSRTNKVKEAAQLGTVKIVNQNWLLETMSRWERQKEDDYLVDIHEGDRKRPDGTTPDIAIPGLDDRFEESSSGTESDDEKENDGFPGSQTDDDFTDEEGVVPKDPESGHSPIDDFADMDWGDMGDELKDLLGSDDDDSDTSSVASESSHRSENGTKRRRGDLTDDDDSDEGSKLSKKQKTSSNRSKEPSRLKESSLPTPIVTGDEKNAEDVDGESDTGSDDQLEADLLAEFEKEGDEDEDGANGLDTA